MGAVASFNWAAFSARYPEFVYIGQAAVGDFWTEATLYHANDGSGPVENEAQQGVLLNMLAAHIAKLNKGYEGQGPSPLVGRLSAATEGSVNVSVENQYPPGSAQWFQQSQYGAAYWAATSIYRRFGYVAGNVRVFDPWKP